MISKLRAFYHNEKVRNPFVWCFILAFCYNLLIETLARNQMPGYGGLYFLFTKPLAFLVNTLIIYATLIISALFKRGTFVTTLISAVWISLGVANGIILTQRMTPFTVKDFSNLGDGATIITTYFSKTQILLIGTAILIAVTAFTILFFKGPKREKKIEYKKTILGILLVILATFGAVAGCIKVGVLNTFFGNLAYAYSDYGVPYCFINTWLNTGIKRPSNYSKDAVLSIFDKSEYMNSDGTMKLPEATNTANTENKPNIIFLQLESFVDPTLFTQYEYSQDPIPFYRSLMKNYSSGSLTVPACGAGTANTEFEVMTGLSVKFFGPGEYPFKSVLKDKPSESIAWDLKNIGYSTHAIHNHRAMFYNRNDVFANIGYDTFTSVEYMSNVERTPKGWAKDKILTSQIMDAMESTKTRDYIYTISVQGHGKYPVDKVLSNPTIRVTKSSADEETTNQVEYYVNELHEMDQFVQNLTEELSSYDEPVILVMYGDHIPALSLTESTYNAKNLYQTQYVIWSNFDMTKQDKNQTAYQLAADVLNRVDIHEGTIIRYHQDKDHSASDYLSNLEMLGYDMLYGNEYIYGGSNPFTRNNMKMGVKTISIDKIVKVNGKYYIKGQNFTEESKVSLDGKVLKTVYLGPNLLGLKEDVDPDDVDKMKVSQIDRSNQDVIISTTE